jgi:hypothetical protein
MKKYILMLHLFLLCCTAKNSDYMQIDKRAGSSEILNYEYSNKYYAAQIRREHFLLNIEIDEPVIIELDSPLVDDIYFVSQIRGDAIVRFQVNESGKVISYAFRKRAGLYLDRYIIEVINKIKIKPVSHRGEKGTAEFNARFIFETRERS